jgi:hypothetical protein
MAYYASLVNFGLVLVGHPRDRQIGPNIFYRDVRVTFMYVCLPPRAQRLPRTRRRTYSTYFPATLVTTVTHSVLTDSPQKCRGVPIQGLFIT